MYDSNIVTLRIVSIGLRQGLESVTLRMSEAQSRRLNSLSPEIAQSYVVILF